MSSLPEAGNNDLLNALADYQKAFAELAELSEQYRAQAAEAREAIKAYALTHQHLKKDSSRLMAKAEVSVQDLAERYLKG